MDIVKEDMDMVGATVESRLKSEVKADDFLWRMVKGER